MGTDINIIWWLLEAACGGGPNSANCRQVKQLQKRLCRGEKRSACNCAFNELCWRSANRRCWPQYCSFTTAQVGDNASAMHNPLSACLEPPAVFLLYIFTECTHNLWLTIKCPTLSYSSPWNFAALGVHGKYSTSRYWYLSTTFFIV